MDTEIINTTPQPSAPSNESLNASLNSNFGELQTTPTNAGSRKVIIIKNRVYNTNEVKEKLEAWKLILLPVNNLLEWERKFDPFIIIFLNTFIFGLLMYYSPSILTTISIVGLVFLLVETAVPVVANYFFKTTEWDPVLDAKYTRICERISNFHQHIINLKLKLEVTRREKQPLYFLIVFFFLVFCAYVGQSIDNFILTYFAVLILALTPGARRRNVLQRLVYKLKSTLGLNKSKKTM